jgi:hypothetical protein
VKKELRSKKNERFPHLVAPVVRLPVARRGAEPPAMLDESGGRGVTPCLLIITLLGIPFAGEDAD